MSTLLRFHAGGVGLALPTALVAAVHPGCRVRRVPGLPAPAVGFIGVADQALAILDGAALLGGRGGAGGQPPSAFVALAAPLEGIAIAVQAPPWISPGGAPATLPLGTGRLCRSADREAGGDVHAILDAGLLGGLLAGAQRADGA